MPLTKSCLHREAEGDVGEDSSHGTEQLQILKYECKVSSGSA